MLEKDNFACINFWTIVMCVISQRRRGSVDASEGSSLARADHGASVADSPPSSFVSHPQLAPTLPLMWCYESKKKSRHALYLHPTSTQPDNGTALNNSFCLEQG
jgi:hypothetical protein